MVDECCVCMRIFPSAFTTSFSFNLCKDCGTFAETLSSFVLSLAELKKDLDMVMPFLTCIYYQHEDLAPRCVE